MLAGRQGETPSGRRDHLAPAPGFSRPEDRTRLRGPSIARCCWRIRFGRSRRYPCEGGDPARRGADPTQPLRHPKNAECHGREHVLQAHLLQSPVARTPGPEQAHGPREGSLDARPSPVLALPLGRRLPELADWTASCSALFGSSVRWRGSSFERVQSARLLHSRQSLRPNLTTMSRLPHGSTVGFHALLCLPSGQVAFFATQSTAKRLMS